MAELTGRKVLLITVTAFGVIIAVNVTMAVQAVSTFPGLEVKNSYVASQSFDADRAAQLALGWTLSRDYDPATGVLRLTFADAGGQPAPVADLSVLVGRATVASDDRRPVFARDGGAFVTPLNLPPGKWLLQVEARAPDGTPFRQRLDLLVRG
ncbi:MAG: FixH family protein [Rhodobacterales bacterium]|nr:FixH family protein [Rhodobacterales bacterium]